MRAVAAVVNGCSSVSSEREREGDSKIDRSGDNEQEIRPQRPTTVRRIQPCYESLSMAGPARERRFRIEETRWQKDVPSFAVLAFGNTGPPRIYDGAEKDR